MKKNSLNKPPKVAIVIPVYNRSKDLQALLNSVFELDFINFDVIVVDNGSIDGVDKVAELYPQIRILRNDRNYGATVGFNTGLKYAGSTDLYKYVWMLDSDLIVGSGSLSALINVVEADQGVGIAGPKILNNADRNLIVEVGAKIDLGSGQVFPLFCNEPDFESNEIFEVDYVGSGISLIRVEAFKKVGIMDERYFFLWDDMDYGLAMKRKGYRVVAVPKAVVYHPPFTEKRGAAVNAYYGIKSPLLTISKYSDSVSRLKCVYSMLRTVLKGAVYRYLSGYGDLAKLSIYALRDFNNNKWGEFNGFKTYIGSKDTGKLMRKWSVNQDVKKVIILPSGSDKDIAQVIDFVRSGSPEAKLVLVIQSYRKHLFEQMRIDEFLIYDDKSKYLLFEHFLLFSRLMKTNADIIVNTCPERGSPFTYAKRKVIDWNKERKCFFESSEDIYSLWKLPVSVLLGEFLALVVCPSIYFASFKYKVKD